MDNENKHLVYIELLKTFNDNKPLEEYIFDFYISNIDIFYKNIIELFEVLKEEKIKNFMSKITDKKEKNNYKVISYDEFFMEKENMNLNLLKELYKKIDLIKKTGYYGCTKEVLEKVYNSIDKKKLKISHLKSLLLNKKENVIKRFELLNILNKSFNPEDIYEELKKKYEKAQKEKEELESISEAFKVFHKEFYKKEIIQIEDAIEKFNSGEIKEFDKISQLKSLLGDDTNIKNKVETINKCKNSSVFKKLFNNTQGKNQDERFDSALNRLYNEFCKLTKKGKLNDEKTKKEFQIIIDILGLKGDKKTEKELRFMEDSSYAEEDIKSMIYFCENFKLNANEFNDNEKPLEETLLSIYENIKNNNKKEESLNKLKKMGIYDCQNKGNNAEFFNLLNNQKEAIDFLLNKSHDNLEIIKDKLISFDNAIKASDIDEVDNCIDFFNNVLRICSNNFELFEKKKENECKFVG